MKPGWWIKDPDRAKDVLALVSDKEISKDDICREYRLTQSMLSGFMRSQGLAAKRKNKKAVPVPFLQPPPKPVTLESVVEEMAALRKKMAELEAVKEQLSIRFEWDGVYVAVYGVNPQPILAKASDWLRFLRLNGAAKLREFAQTQERVG